MTGYHTAKERTYVTIERKITSDRISDKTWNCKSVNWIRMINGAQIHHYFNFSVRSDSKSMRRHQVAQNVWTRCLVYFLWSWCLGMLWLPRDLHQIAVQLNLYSFIFDKQISMRIISRGCLLVIVVGFIFFSVKIVHYKWTHVQT